MPILAATDPSQMRLRSALMSLASVGAGMAFGRVAAQIVGGTWSPQGVGFTEWMASRFSHQISNFEIAGFLLVLYGGAAVSGIFTAGLATMSRRFGARAPLPWLAACATLLNAAIISPIQVVIGTEVMMRATLVAVGIAVSFGVLLDRALGPIPGPLPPPHHSAQEPSSF